MPLDHDAGDGQGSSPEEAVEGAGNALFPDDRRGLRGALSGQGGSDRGQVERSGTDEHAQADNGCEAECAEHQ